MEAAGGALVGSDGEPIGWDGVHPVPRNNPDFFGARSLAVARELATRYREAIERAGMA